MRRALLVSTAVAGSMMTACYGPSPAEDAGTRIIDEDWPRDGSTASYVVGEITIPDAPAGAGMNVVPGLNVDAKVSDGTAPTDCEDVHRDYVSAQGETGVDNQLVGALGGGIPGVTMDLESELEREMARGALLLAIRVNDIHSFENDSNVTIDLFLVDPADCAASPCPPGVRIEPGASWRQQLGPALATGLAGTIEDGTLRGGPLDLWIALDASRTSSLTIRDAMFTARISQESLVMGNLGGALRVEDLAMSAESITTGAGETTRAALAPSADLDPSEDDVNECRSISVGLGFTAVEGAIE